MKPYLILVSLALVTLISGCSQVNVNEQLSEAQLALSENKYKESEILLKNVLQEAPDNGEANNLLAVSYFRQGQMENAEKQFNRAFRQNSLSDETRIFWLQTLLLQQDSEGLEDVINKISVPSIDEAIGFYSLYTTNDNAQPSSMQPDKNPSSSLSVYTRAQSCVQLRLGSKYREALACLVAFQNEQAFNLEYLFESANNHIALGNIEEYGAAVTAVSALFPNFDRYQLLKADALVKLEDFDAASTLVAKLLAVYSKQPYLNYLQAVIESKNGNVEAAKRFAELAINYGFDNRNSRTIAALSAYRLGDYEQAYKHFTPFAKDITSASALYRIYSLTLLRLGYAQEVAASFDNIEVLDSSDYAFFQSTAQYLQSVGNKAMARSMLERFESVIQDGDENYSSLNISQLKLNDVKALQNLESLNSDGNADKAVVLALADYYLRAGDVKAAMQIAEEIQTDFDDDYTATILMGRAYELSADYAKARQSFKEVYSIKNDSASALAFFVDDAVRNDNLDEAENYAQTLYELFPNQPATLQKYLGILNRQEKPLQSKNVAKNAYEQNSTSGQFVAIYASLLANTGSHAQALNILSSIEQSPSLPPLFWLTKARSELATAKLKEAEETADSWLSYNPTFKPTYLFAANVYELTGNIAGSISTLKAAERFFTDDDEIYIMSAYYLTRQGDLDAAERQLNKVNEDSYSLVAYKGVKGQLLLLQGEFSQASSVLLEHYNVVKNYRILNLLTQALINNSQTDLALELVSAFVDDNPDAVGSLELLAELYIGKDHQQAITTYQRVLELAPDNHAAMNNSAWLLYFNGKSDEGLKYSQQALQIHPDNPDYLDTHGMILLRLGQVDESIRVLMQSIAIKPDSVSIRLHLAEAFKIAGLDRESEEAIRRVDTKNAPWQSEIQRIRAL